MSKIRKLAFIISVICMKGVMAQVADTPAVQPPKEFINYANPRTYEIANIVITGTNYYDKSVLVVLSGLQVGQKIRIPSEDITKAITNLYKQKLFDDVSMRIMDIQQEQLARSLGDGHRVIHGVAGSGKTLILGYRCLHFGRHQLRAQSLSF